MNDKTQDEVSVAASIVGQQAAGVPKNFSQAERERRAERMRAMNKARVEGVKTQRVEGRVVPPDPPQPQERSVLISIRGR